MSNNSGYFVVVVPAGVEIAVKAREVTARHFDSNAVAGRKVVTRVHGLERYLVYLPRLHPHKRFVVAIAIAEALNGFIKIVSSAIGIDIDDLCGKISVFYIRGNV